MAGGGPCLGEGGDLEAAEMGDCLACEWAVGWGLVTGPQPITLAGSTSLT